MSDPNPNPDPAGEAEICVTGCVKQSHFIPKSLVKKEFSTKYIEESENQSKKQHLLIVVKTSPKSSQDSS